MSEKVKMFIQMPEDAVSGFEEFAKDNGGLSTNTVVLMLAFRGLALEEANKVKRSRGLLA